MKRGGDQVALDWLKDEIASTLQLARGALENYVDTRDETRMRACLTDLHQVHGTLVMLELEGVAVLSGHMERLAQSLLNGAIGDREQGCEVLMQGIIELPMVLEEIKRGTADSLALVRPLADQVRAVLGLGPLGAGGASSPDPERDLQARARFLQIDGVDKVRRIRSAYQQTLLALLKGESAGSTGGALGKVALALLRVCEGTPYELLWKAFAEYAAALDAVAAAPDSAGLKLLRRIDAEIRSLGRDGESALASAPSQTLVRQLVETARALGRGSRSD
jgi:chemosensory pili system protein ChpA (sensor histidine kinase/response regulator)